MLKVTPILGVVSIKFGGELEDAKPANNNTRWIFDVDGTLEGPLVLQLIEMRTGREISPELVAGSFLARSPTFYDARPYLLTQQGGLLTIIHGDPRTKDVDGKPILCTYRVMIDVLHTATR